jgi:Na+-translocating ferredoxin:NAD+ oxidoreductase RnfG subunit
MPKSYIIIALILVIAIAAAVVSTIFYSRKAEIEKLKQKYRRLTFLSPKAADETLRLQIIKLRNKRPGRSEKWYIEKAIYDLERNRR